MSLQTLFALVPAITAFVPTASPSGSALPHPASTVAVIAASACVPYCIGRFNGTVVTSITINGGRHFAARVIAPSRPSETKYPGAIIIATEETRDRAFAVANNMAQIGVTTIMYTQEVNATRRLLLHDARAAIDTMRRRYDVRAAEVGVVAFEEAAEIMPSLIRDTTLSFAIAASGDESLHPVNVRYNVSHAATLLVQGIDSPGEADGTGAVTKLAGVASTMPHIILPEQTPAETQPFAAPSAGSNDVESNDMVVAGSSSYTVDPDESYDVAPDPNSKISPNVTVWPVPKKQLETIGEAHSPLGLRMVTWLREQVHASPSARQASPIDIH